MLSLVAEFARRRHTHAFEVGRRETIAAYRAPGRLPSDPEERLMAMGLTLMRAAEPMHTALAMMREVEALEGPNQSVQDSADQALGALCALYTYFRLLGRHLITTRERQILDDALTQGVSFPTLTHDDGGLWA